MPYYDINLRRGPDVPTKAQIEQQLTETQAELRALQIAKAGVEEGYRKFKDKVREAVKEAKEEHELCDEGVTEFLESLDLKPLVGKYEVPVVITANVMLRVEGQEDPIAYLQESMNTLVDPDEFLAEVFCNIDDFNYRYGSVPFVGKADKSSGLRLVSGTIQPQKNEIKVTFGDAREVD